MDAISRTENRTRFTPEDATCSPKDAEQARKEADRAAEERANQIYSAPATDARGASRAVPTANKTEDWSAAKKDSERTRKLDGPVESDPLGNALIGLPGQIVAKGVQWLGIHIAKELIMKAFVDTFKPTPEVPGDG
jgi:septal ring factor EnvC (AmiA/AmiB activator)